MGVIVGKGLSLGAVITVMILLNSSRSGAIDASLKEFNGSGHLAAIGANMELEFLMGTDVGRMLAGEKSVTEGTKNRNKPAVDCERGIPYESCTPPGKKPKVPEQCYIYKRGCPST